MAAPLGFNLEDAMEAVYSLLTVSELGMGRVACFSRSDK